MYETLKKHIGGGGYSKFTFNVIIDYGAKKYTLTIQELITPNLLTHK